MADAIPTDDDVQFIGETQPDSRPLQSVLQTGSHRPSNPSSWSDLSMAVPNDATTARILAFVECILVELTHEPVGAVYRSNEEWGVIETVTVHADWTSISTDEPFVRYRRDPRAGFQCSTYSRTAVRDALVERLSREGAGSVPVSTGSFCVYPLSTLSRLD